MTTKFSRLLKRYIATLPERQRQRRERFPDGGEEYIGFKVDAPESPVTALPTLDGEIVRPLSPHLRDWHEIAGTLIESSWKYLSPSAIKSAVENSRVKEVVEAHREYWDDSAPMQFPNSQLSIFALIGHPDDGDLIYLVWPKTDIVEPEVWEYVGQSETRYKDLSAYITSLLES